MNYTIFKLSYIMYLQKKYYSQAKLGNQNVYVLPPILKRIGIFYSLAFPVAQRFKKDTLSRPVGVIIVNNCGKEKYYDMTNYEFSFKSQNFEKRYSYYTYKQEYLKVTLEILQSVYPKLSLFKNKSYEEKYLDRLKKSFDNEYWQFYEDLAFNKIQPVNEDIIFSRNHIKTENEIIDKVNAVSTKKLGQKELKQKLKRFILDEIWPDLIQKNGFVKINFLDMLGNDLKNITTGGDFEKSFKQARFTIAKDYAKAVNSVTENSVEVDFLSRITIIFMNAMLIEEKENKVIQDFEDEISESKKIFENEINSIKDEKSKIILTRIFDGIKKDYLTIDKSKLSNSFSAYLFLFL